VTKTFEIKLDVVEADVMDGEVFFAPHPQPPAGLFVSSVLIILFINFLLAETNL
jgi:hypothetical protein